MEHQRLCHRNDVQNLQAYTNIASLDLYEESQKGTAVRKAASFGMECASDHPYDEVLDRSVISDLHEMKNEIILGCCKTVQTSCDICRFGHLRHNAGKSGYT